MVPPPVQRKKNTCLRVFFRRHSFAYSSVSDLIQLKLCVHSKSVSLLKRRKVKITPLLLETRAGTLSFVFKAVATRDWPR